MPPVKKAITMQEKIIEALQKTWQAIAPELLELYDGTIERNEVIGYSSDLVDTWCQDSDVIKAFRDMEEEEQEAITLQAFPDELYG